MPKSLWQPFQLLQLHWKNNLLASMIPWCQWWWRSWTVCKKNKMKSKCSWLSVWVSSWLQYPRIEKNNSLMTLKPLCKYFFSIKAHLRRMIFNIPHFSAFTLKLLKEWNQNLQLTYQMFSIESNKPLKSTLDSQFRISTKIKLPLPTK